MGLDVDDHDYFVSPDLSLTSSRTFSRTGVLAIEEEDELKLGVNLDPDNQANSFALVEETSHLVWRAANDLPVSQLVLEFQSEVDRFLHFSHDFSYLGFSRSEAGRIYDWVNRRYEARYEIAGSRLIATATVLSRRSDHGVTPQGWHVNLVVTTARRPR
jgi:hypothetical protein